MFLWPQRSLQQTLEPLDEDLLAATATLGDMVGNTGHNDPGY